MEVDFLLARGKEFVALKVKHSERIHREDLGGLIAISGLKGLRRRMVGCLSGKDLEDRALLADGAALLRRLEKKEHDRCAPRSAG